MVGYHNHPEATADMVRDGWVYSGDIGEIDADGFLKITDRKKALFKTAVGKYVGAAAAGVSSSCATTLIDRAVIVGESKPFVTALVVPDWDAARKEGLDENGLKAHVQKLRRRGQRVPRQFGRRSSTSPSSLKTSPRPMESCRSSWTSSGRWSRTIPGPDRVDVREEERLVIWRHGRPGGHVRTARGARSSSSTAFCHCGLKGECLGCKGIEMVRVQAEGVVAAASQPILIQVAQEASMKDMSTRFQAMSDRLLSDPEIRRSPRRCSSG